ncbi:MAG: hypothetical protein HYT98_03110 [Candidatus Sungbacteria bacterium]|nr:hypothetical protein [Candidatus Sungbacteria bacterium]
MPNIQIFPYGITLREGGAVDVFPAAEVTFEVSKNERLTLFFIIDSGAAISALPKSDAPMLGIDAKSGILTNISGVGGNSVIGWTHEVAVGLGKYNLKLPIVFLDHSEAPRVLGRAGLFNRYTIIFEETKHRSSFMDNSTKESRKIAKIVDGGAS